MPEPRPARRDRPRWVIAELDVDGEIDDHAAMCLQHAIDGARAGAAAMILADLRELEAIDAGGVELFLRHHADCRCGASRQIH
jgi:anti-anti-sigma regulatory factor